MSQSKPIPNFSLKPNGNTSRSSRPNDSAKPGTTSQPNPNYVPPASVKKNK